MSDTTSFIELESEDFDVDGLVLRHLRGHEAISELYHFDLVFVARDDDGLPDAEEVVGASVTLVFKDAAGSPVRTVRGIAAHARRHRTDEGGGGTLELRLVPRAWRATQFHTQEVFVDQSIVDIIQDKLGRLHLADGAVFSLAREMPRRELVVQYDESDWSFICRLCEHAGIAFYFRDTEEGEQLVFADGDLGWGELAEPLHYGERSEEDGVHQLATVARSMPQIYAVSDYNYRTPDVDLSAVEQLEGGQPGGMIEFGTHHRDPAAGAVMAQIRREEAACRRVVHEGEGNAVALAPGWKFTVDGHGDVDGEQLLVSEVVHEANFADAAGDADAPAYHNRFVAHPGALPFRPRRATPRPRIHGILSAIVQPGPDGEVGGLPHIDDDGRYFVRFHFDRSHTGAPPSSQPMRMAQPFVGDGASGMHFPLQRGTEVLLAFIDGNPDRPVIVGAVPNAANPATVTRRTAVLNKIQTTAGIAIEFGGRTSS